MDAHAPAQAGHPDSWRDFQIGPWQHAIDIRDFIVRNIATYEGDDKFLVGMSARTKAVWAKLQPYFAEERKKGVLDADAATPSSMLAHAGCSPAR